MTLFIWICYFICGIMLFIGNDFLRRKYKIKKFESIIFSLIYLMIVGGIVSHYGWISFNDNLFIIIVFCFVIDIIYTSYFLEKNFFDNDEDNVFYYLVLIFSSFILNQGFFNKVEVIFPTGEDLRIILWLLVVVFLYNFFKNYRVFNSNNNDLSKPTIDGEYIIVSYAKLRHRFLDDIDFSNKDLELVVFSIMVFENYRCPAFFRKINNAIFRFDSKPRKLGIMQVVSKKFISDVESIEMVYKKLERIVNSKSKVKIKNMSDVINKYDKENGDTINYIYDVICNFSKK